MKLFLRKVINKFKYAFDGLLYGLMHDQSIQIQYGIGFIVILFCLFLPLSKIEWSIILILIGLVITLEYLNSAIERICDFISSEYDPRIKVIKDYGSAFVLVMSIVAAIIALLVIGDKLWMVLF